MTKIRTSTITEHLHRMYPDAIVHSIAYNTIDQVGYATMTIKQTENPDKSPITNKVIRFEYNKAGITSQDLLQL